MKTFLRRLAERAIGRAIVGTTLALVLTACKPAAEPPTPADVSGEWREFEGSWNAAGSRRTIPLGTERKGSIVDLRGTMLLAGKGRPGVGFRSEVIALVDSETGLLGRSVWTDERGQQVFSELKGEGTAARNRIEGTIQGGTGRYAGATGTYEFSWQFVIEAEDGSIQGRAVGLKGRFRIGQPGGGKLAAMIAPGLLLKRAAPFALAIGIWFAPVPAGLTAPAWHLFAVFTAAIACVLIGSFPLLTASMIAVATVVLTGTITPAQAFSGFANSSVLLVVIAFIVAQAVVKSGLGTRISLLMVSRFGGSPLGLAYSLVLTDAAIAPAFPSNTARGGVLFPIVLSIAKGAGSEPDSPEGRRLGGYLMFCAMASLAVSSALWLTATSANPIGVQIAQNAGFKLSFGSWLIASSVPTLTAILILPLLVSKIFPPGVGATPDAPAAARKDLAGMGRMSRNEWITAVIFLVMVAGWVFGNALNLNGTSVAFMGFGVLLVAGVLTLDDISTQGDTLVTFLWLAVLFALSAQLNELGFMGYVGERLASRLGGLSWPVLYLTLVALYVGLHYFFVSQTSQVLALLAVFLDVGIRGGVPAPLMAPGLLFASSYFSVITPQGGSQNIIFVASGYLKQGELYKLGLVTTLAFMAVYLLIGTPWVFFVA